MDILDRYLRHIEEPAQGYIALGYRVLEMAQHDVKFQRKAGLLRGASPVTQARAEEIARKRPEPMEQVLFHWFISVGEPRTLLDFWNKGEAQDWVDKLNSIMSVKAACAELGTKKRRKDDKQK